MYTVVIKSSITRFSLIGFNSCVSKREGNKGNEGICKVMFINANHRI